MKAVNLLDTCWRPCKAFIYQGLCCGNYARYLRLKAKMITFASSLGLYEKQHLGMLGSFVTHGDSTIDVGSHYGIYAGALSKLVGNNGKVLALEPLPEVFEVLAYRMRNLLNVECRNCAASDGTILSLQLSVPSMVGGVPEPALASQHVSQESIYKVYNVACMKLDEFKSQSKITFIKIDVEGHEAEVLRGGYNIIQRDKPLIQVEISNSSFQLACNQEPFGMPGYEVAVLKNKKLHTVKTVEEEGIYYLRPKLCD